MRADPEPDDFVPFQDPYRSIVRADPNRVEWAAGMHRLKTETGMIRVLSEESVGAAGLTLNLGRQFGKGSPELRSGARDHSFSGSSSFVRPARCSANASSASWPSRSWDPAKSSSHRRSEASSSSNMRASASCSFSGSLDASSNAFFKSFVISTLGKEILSQSPVRIDPNYPPFPKAATRQWQRIPWPLYLFAA